MPRRNSLEIWVSETALPVSVEGSLGENIKVLQSTSFQIIKRKVQFNISNS